MKKKSVFTRIMHFAGGLKAFIYLSFITSGLSTIIGVLPFIYLWKIMQEILLVMPNFHDSENLLYYSIMAFLFTIISIILYYISLTFSHLCAFKIADNIKKETSRHIAKLPIGTINSIGTGKVRKIIDECSAATETYMAHNLPDMVGSYTTPIIVLVVMFIFGWCLGLASLIPILFAFLLMLKNMTGKEALKRMQQYNDVSAEMSNEAVEYVRGIAVIKTFGQTVFSFQRFKNTIDSYKNFCTDYAYSTRISMSGFMTAINSIFAALILLALFYIPYAKDYTIFLLDFIFYAIFTPIITILLTKVLFSGNNSMHVMDSLNRIDSILALKPLEDILHKENPKNMEIAFDNVSFSYENTEKLAVKDISLNISQGEKIALVGPSGGGKSTTACLLARFWDVTSGKITIGNVDIKNITEDILMDMVSYVFQDNKLLKESIFENVRLGNPTATEDEVNNALHLAQCDDIIVKLPKGIHTVIGTKGVYLSGGETQRIAIARAILKNAPIIIFDEATAFADPENEHLVYEAFSQLTKEKTVIMIAHRLSTIVNVNKIYVLEDGSIVESGSHQELLQKNSKYNKMWNEYNSSVSWSIKDGGNI